MATVTPVASVTTTALTRKNVLWACVPALLATIGYFLGWVVLAQLDNALVFLLVLVVEVVLATVLAYWVAERVRFALSMRDASHLPRSATLSKFLFVRDLSMLRERWRRQLERETCVERLEDAVRDDIQDLGGPSLRRALKVVESALNAFDSDKEVAEQVEDDLLQLMHERVVRAVVRELAVQVGLDLLDRRVLSNFMEDHDAQLTLDRMDVHHTADPVSGMRQAMRQLLVPDIAHKPSTQDYRL